MSEITLVRLMSMGKRELSAQSIATLPHACYNYIAYEKLIPRRCRRSKPSFDY